jgi:moderate conductance mechanosensitive channel
MRTETLTIVLVLVIGGVACAVLQWIVRALCDRLLSRERLTPTADGQPLLSGHTLLVNWLGYGLRTFIWTAYGWLAVYLLPHTRSQVESVGGRMQRLSENLVDWLTSRGLNAAIAIIIIVFVMRFAAAGIETIFVLMKRRANGLDVSAAHRRLSTLSTIFSGASQTVIFFVGLMVVLQQLNVNITPILASAGVVGIAIGFGAQSLIRDLFSGFLILLEDQFSVGDIVRIGEFAGTVEQITLRATRIRAIDGALTTIPNGHIATISNLTRDWSQVALDIEIDYTEDADRAMMIALDTARILHADLPSQIIEAPSMLGIDRLSPAAVVLRLLVRTAPSKQFDIARELRRRIKLAFESHGIRPPATWRQILASEEPARGQATPAESAAVSSR